MGAIRDRHDPQPALEVRNIETHRCRARVVDPNRSGKQRDDAAALVGQTRDRPFGELVAAAAQYADAIGARVDQPSVQVAQFDAEPALAVEIFFGCRTVELGQFQHRLIDGGHRHEGLLAAGDAVHLDRDIDRSARPGYRRHGQLDPQGSRRRIDAEPGDADSTPRPARLRTLEGGRPVGADQSINAAAPAVRDRNIDRGAVARQRNRAHRQDPIGGNRDLGLTGERRLDEQFRSVARPITGLVGGHFELVRHIGHFGLDPPSDTETQARLRAAIALDHFPAIPAGRQVPGKRPRRVLFYVQCAGLDRHVAHLASVPPDAVDRVPVVLPSLAQQFPA